jgi:16S rRNA (adenine1518-N6/adenine1519-N6)-dimethyltransferase
VEIIQGDALKLNLSALIAEKFPDRKVCVVANLPYYITTPLIMKFLEESLPLESVTVMIQKEVAERMTAEPGSKAYGALSLAVRYYCAPELVTLVPPEAFMPPPKVTSAIIRLNIAGHVKPSVSDEKLLFSIIKAAFGQRRKTLVNALSAAFDIEKEDVKAVVRAVCGNENVRGEALSLGQFIQICENFIFLFSN